MGLVISLEGFVDAYGFVDVEGSEEEHEGNCEENEGDDAVAVVDDHDCGARADEGMIMKGGEVNNCNNERTCTVLATDGVLHFSRVAAAPLLSKRKEQGKVSS